MQEPADPSLPALSRARAPELPADSWGGLAVACLVCLLVGLAAVSAYAALVPGLPL